MTYYPPKQEEREFNCIHCGVFATQYWAGMYISDFKQISSLRVCKCRHCSRLSYWLDGRMIVPPHNVVESPHPDLPEDCVPDFQEAREVYGCSPKAAAALLRLLVQKLMPYLGGNGNNINDDIASLVKNGLAVEVQQALDYCRVVGNNAVHPGKINLDDTPEVALSLFRMINFIVDQMITQKKKIRELYEKLPEGVLKQIEKRDKSES